MSKKSELEWLLDEIASMPWWCGLIMTGIVFLVFYYALPWSIGSENAANATIGKIIKGIAPWIACLCLLATGISFVKGLFRRR